MLEPVKAGRRQPERRKQPVDGSNGAAGDEGERAVQLPLQRPEQRQQVAVDPNRVGMGGVFQESAVDIEEKGELYRLEIEQRRIRQRLHRADARRSNIDMTLAWRGGSSLPVTRSRSPRLRSRAASSSIEPAQR